MNLYKTGYEHTAIIMISKINSMPNGNLPWLSMIVTAPSHWGALNVHRLTRKFLSQFRGIAEVVKEFMEYIADSPLLAHNAKFDI